MAISPPNSVPKKESEDRRIILDLSFGEFEEPRKPNQMPVPGTAWNLSVSPF
jgi:hypothetical protein